MDSLYIKSKRKEEMGECNLVGETYELIYTNRDDCAKNKSITIRTRSFDDVSKTVYHNIVNFLDTINYTDEDHCKHTLDKVNEKREKLINELIKLSQ